VGFEDHGVQGKVKSFEGQINTRSTIRESTHQSRLSTARTPRRPASSAANGKMAQNRASEGAAHGSRVVLVLKADGEKKSS